MIVLRTPLWGGRLGVRSLFPEDVGQAYVGWLNDPETIMYTEARHETHSFETLLTYVESLGTRENEHLMGIFEKLGGRHVGNIKLGPVHPRQLCASIGVIIGEKDCRGRGYATEAIGLAVRFAFEQLKLHKLTAGVIQGNEASLRAFEKNLFIIEGVRRKQNCCGGAWRDETLLGLLAEDWSNA